MQRLQLQKFLNFDWSFLSESLLSWRILSWRTVKRITTYVTTSVVMMAVRTVMAQQADTSDSVSSSEKMSRYSFVSSVSSSSRRVVDAGASMLAASKDHLKKRPILLWIPLIPLLIFLALVGECYPLSSNVIPTIWGKRCMFSV